MTKVATMADKIAIETQTPWAERQSARTLFEFVGNTANAWPDRPAVSFQLKSGPTDKNVTVSWADLRANVARTANMLRRIGIGETDVVAYILPNSLETVYTLLGGATAGIVNPINPLLEPEQISAILRETGARAVVTLAPFPKTDVAQKVAEAVRHAPNVKTVLQVDLKRYLSPPISWLVPLLRPKLEVHHHADVLDFAAEIARENPTLDFAETGEDRVAAYFHTGGTTGMPKVAQHRYSGMIYNGWCGHEYMFTEEDVLVCPLPLFHVMAAYPILMSCISSGAHMVMPTPAGYRGDGVFDNFWKLVERYRVTFLVTVPTAAAALMQRPVDADVSSLKYAISGSAPLPVELFKKFEDATGITILEGYGMTEATCLVSINPPFGERKIGSVGLPFPYTEVRILHSDENGTIVKECETDEVGEICVSNPGVIPGSTYTEHAKNHGLFANDEYLRTGDLGRIDADGYIWITGRAKDLIIRGGHNIDPAVIEEALMAHPDVSFVGAIGQPDAHSGELPCAYVELREGAEVDDKTLYQFAKSHIVERAAVPKHVEILGELPKTAVGKVFKPDLRKLAITRVYDKALEDGGLTCRVAGVVEDKKLGLVAELGRDESDEAAVNGVLGSFSRPWRWAE
ncbi:acyl-CoA synthetase [Oceanomicrobium pacificus]|uniref:Acyl-CoA synthetase n=1 Tax=Oceanomicrobium pacificus TaxID=2692916 RepID=A0A6B0U6Q6_9RHOB|nr:acyl-CoA synthetase [Oceanomicrobium pacificus]MXU66531.1 acyl-CoA synthetase [Oceanomicrobium pacificus]